MPKTSSNPKPKYFPNLPRISQATNSQCGPATLAMLLSNLGIKISQKRIANERPISPAKLKKHGSTVWELAKVNKKISKMDFWYKENATIKEINDLITKHKYPVGVEWRGEFLQYSDGDEGHYSVVTHISKDKDCIYIADPYKHFAGKDRKIKIDRFKKLWWDVNEIKNRQTGKMRVSTDYRLIFILTPKGETFPLEMGMIML